MDLIIWSPELSVGIKEIDKQHQVLIYIINRLSEAKENGSSKKEMSTIMDGLSDYVHVHFNYEEKLLKENGYDDYLEHKKTHQVFIDQLRIFANQLKTNSANLSSSLLHFLQEWLTNHILGHDKDYSDFLHNKGIK